MSGQAKTTKIICCNCNKDYSFELFESKEGYLLFCPHCGEAHSVVFKPIDVAKVFERKESVRLGTYYVNEHYSRVPGYA